MFVLVTGGSGSGKSAYAEDRIMQMADPERIYLATMACYDEESRQRIARHRRLRAGKGFDTVERPTDLAGLSLGGDTAAKRSILLECMSNLAANEMFAPDGDKKDVFELVCRGIDTLMRECHNLVVVTNEVFSDGIEYDPMTRTYQEVLGRINAWMGQRADEVVEVVCGIPIQQKGCADRKAVL